MREEKDRQSRDFACLFLCGILNCVCCELEWSETLWEMTEDRLGGVQSYETGKTSELVS